MATNEERDLVRADRVNPDEDDEEREDEEETEDEEEESDPNRPRAPSAPGAPVVHLAIEGRTQRPSGRRGKKRGAEKEPTAEEKAAAKQRADQVATFVGMFRTGAQPNGGIQLAITRLKPEVFDFGDGRGPVTTKGYCGTVYDPAECTEEYIESLWGGEKYLLQVRGPDAEGKGLKHLEATQVNIQGPPKPKQMGTAPLQTSVPATLGVPARISPEESRILGTAMAQQKEVAERTHEDLRNARERSDKLSADNAILAAQAAKAEAKAESLEARLAALEHQITAGGAASRKDENTALTLILDMRKEDARRYELEMQRREKEEERKLASHSSPLLDWIKQQDAAHERERKAEAERQKAFMEQQRMMQETATKQQQTFMEMQLKAAEDRSTRLIDELKEARAEKKKEPDLVAQIEKLATLRESFDSLVGGDGDGDSIAKTIIKTLPEIAERFPQIGAAVRHMWTGQPYQQGALPPAGDEEAPPGAIGGVPAKSGAEEAAARDQAAMIGRLISILEATLANGAALEQVARTIRDKFPADAVTAVAEQDPEKVIPELRKFCKPGSPLTTVAGGEHIRKVLDAIREMLEQG